MLEQELRKVQIELPEQMLQTLLEELVAVVVIQMKVVRKVEMVEMVLSRVLVAEQRQEIPVQVEINKMVLVGV